LKKIKPSQFALAQVAVWAVGEFGEKLISAEGAAEAAVDTDIKFQAVEEKAVLLVLKRLATHPEADTTLKQYILTTLVKLSPRFQDPEQLIPALLNTFKRSIVVEIQQRAVEYSSLAAPEHKALHPRVLQRMPRFESKEKVLDESDSDSDSSSSDSDSSDDEGDTAAPAQTTVAPVVETAPAPAPEMDLLGIFGDMGVSSTTSAPAQPMQSTPSGGLDLMGMFGTPAPTTTPTPVPVANTGGDLLDIFGNSTPVAPVQPALSPAVYESAALSLHFSHQPNAMNPSVCETKATFVSKGMSLTNFEFQVAYPKFLQLVMQPASAANLDPSSPLTQSFTITNSAHGTKKPVIRFRINYVSNGQPVTEQGQSNSFP
jgi:AP-1 complex subunit gamma-1